MLLREEDDSWARTGHTSYPVDHQLDRCVLELLKGLSHRGEGGRVL
ncbi:MAG TPA: hypothetical protein GXX55_04710 [Firmicutes bacterium]|nr:hypothetical protein [Bacillota bacterium]